MLFSGSECCPPDVTSNQDKPNAFFHYPPSLYFLLLFLFSILFFIWILLKNIKKKYFYLINFEVIWSTPKSSFKHWLKLDQVCWIFIQVFKNTTRRLMIKSTISLILKSRWGLWLLTSKPILEGSRKCSVFSINTMRLEGEQHIHAFF